MKLKLARLKEHRGAAGALVAACTAVALLGAACSDGGSNRVPTAAAPGQPPQSLTSGGDNAASSVPETAQTPGSDMASNAAPAPDAGAAATTPAGAPSVSAASRSATSGSASPAGAPSGSAAPAPAPGGKAAAGHSGTQTSTPSGGSSAAPTPSAPGQPGGPLTASDRGVTESRIKLGSISAVNTPLGNIAAGPVRTTVVAAMRAVNDNGGIYGRKLEVVDCDDSGNSSQFRACFRKLVDQEKIFALTSSVTWGSGEAHADLAKDQVPWIGSWGYYTSEWKDPWMFPMHMASIHEAHAGAEWVRDVIKPKTVGILFLNSPEQQLAKAAVRQVLDAAGIKTVREVGQEIETPDESQNVLSMRAANPDFVIHYSWAPPVVKWMVDAANQGYWPPKGVMGNHFLGQVIAELVGTWPLQGMWTVSSYELWGTEYVATVEKYAPQMKARNHHNTQTGFIAVKIFTEAAKEVGPNLTRDAIMKALASHRWDAGPGLGASFTWNPGNHDTMRCEYMFKYASSDSSSYKAFVPDPTKYRVCDDID
jgi:ABC-type branched-subunit amino acid transport system substrate-binding protein